MFAWYRDAARCYVYLSDVSTGGSTSGLSNQQPWSLAFRQSRWFTRGWTLQELIAPESVEFFSGEAQRLGDKRSMVQEIHEITGISVQVLQGQPLSELSNDERMLWANRRETKREEDAAYSLLGIFDVHIPLIYGEGRRKAFARLQREISQNSSGQHPAQSHQVAHMHNGPQFNGPISGRFVISGTSVSGGTVNFDFRGS